MNLFYLLSSINKIKEKAEKEKREPNNSEKAEIKNLLIDFINESRKNFKEQNYIQEQRGIKNPQLLNYYSLGYDSESQFLIMPNSPSNQEYIFISRITKKGKKDFIKSPKIEKGENHYFNLEALRADFVFITEGVIDSLSIYEELLKKPNENLLRTGIIFNSKINKTIGAIGLNGLDTEELKKVLEEKRKKNEEEYKNKCLVLSLDNDPLNENNEAEKGRAKKIELNEELNNLGFNSYLAEWTEIITTAEGEKHIKDLNDNLLLNSNFYNEILNNIKLNFKEEKEKKEEEEREKEEEEYINNTSSLNVFNEYNSRPPQEPKPTKWRAFNRVIGDGITPNLYFIGAVSSLGKSTFCLNMALDLIAMGKANGENDIFYFSLEMSTNFIIEKILSTISRKITTANPTEHDLKGFQIYDYKRLKRGKSTNINIYTLAKKAEQKFINDYARNLFIFERKTRITTEDIENEIKKYIRIRNKKNNGKFKKPIVFIDYLQILDSNKTYGNETDKQKIDNIIVDLKTMKNKYDIPIITISSFNRDNYNTEANTASFKDSGEIEYTADYTLALEPKGIKTTTKESKSDIKGNKEIINNYLEQEESEVVLTLLKNREGATRSKIAFNYEKKFNYFEEKGQIIMKNGTEEIIK